MTPEAETFRTERWPTTTSVGILLRPKPRSYGLLLVKIQGQWGLPAGGIKKGEYPIAGIRRELAEETGIDPNTILFYSLAPTTIICLPQENRTQLSLVFQATYLGPHLPKTGRPVQEDKVDCVKPFSLSELTQLAEDQLTIDNEQSAPIYKPHFNFPLITSWIIAHLPPHLTKDFCQRHPSLEGLQQSRTGWSYQPSCFIGTQIQKTTRRRGDYRWGP